MSKHSKTAVHVTPASRVAEFGSRTTEVSEQDTAQFTYKRNAAELGRFCRDEPWNFANWSAEFGKIFRGKLWALIIMLHNSTSSSNRSPPYKHILITNLLMATSDM